MKIITWIVIGVSFTAGQFWALGMREIFPPAQATVMCEMPAEVKHMEAIMASMPLDITVTEIGEPPRPVRSAPRPHRVDPALIEAGLVK